MPQASTKANSIAARSRIKGNSLLFVFVILTSLVPTKIREVNTARWFRLLSRKQSRNEPITIFGDGQQTRDFIYVKDVVAANAFFALQSQATGVFNVACGRQITISDLAITIRKLTKSRSTIEYGAERPGDVKHSVAGMDKTLRAGFSPVWDFAEGLRATIAFFKEEPAAIQQSRHV